MLLRVTAFLVAAAISCTLAMAQGAKPNDAQIAHIAYTAGDIDIKAAQLALQKSTNKDVRGFAEDMVRDHKAVNDQALALVKKLNVTPQDNPTSQALVKQADGKRTELSKLSGQAFDRAYVDNEVAYHKVVIDAASNVLIPNAQNAELKSALQGAAPLFQGHLEHAQKVQTDLGSGKKGSKHKKGETSGR